MRENAVQVVGADIHKQAFLHNLHLARVSRLMPMDGRSLQTPVYLLVVPGKSGDSLHPKSRDFSLAPVLFPNSNFSNPSSSTPQRPRSVRSSYVRLRQLPLFHSQYCSLALPPGRGNAAFAFLSCFAQNRPKTEGTKKTPEVNLRGLVL